MPVLPNPPAKAGRSSELERCARMSRTELYDHIYSRVHAPEDLAELLTDVILQWAEFAKRMPDSQT